jgi:hypothetical protein
MLRDGAFFLQAFQAPGRLVPEGAAYLHDVGALDPAAVAECLAPLLAGLSIK